MKFYLKNVKTAVLIGAGHGIGLALAKKLLSSSTEAKIYCTYRKKEKALELLKLQKENKERLKIYPLDPVQDLQVQNFVSSIPELEVELLLNTVGFLTSDLQGPEKSLRDIKLENLVEVFKVNAAVTPLLAKHFHKKFRHKKPSCFAALSAKVGSISDNRLGGWYAYRASKAALNMFVKGISLEYSRRGCKTVVLSLHPGTTATELSKDFIKNTPYKVHSATETAENLLALIEGKSLSDTGRFYSWNGESLEW